MCLQAKAFLRNFTSERTIIEADGS